MRCAGLLVALAVFALPTTAGAGDRDPAYAQANDRLARATPAFPRARTLIQERMGGGVGDVEFQAVVRISFLARARPQRVVDRFYSERLGGAWHRRGPMCHVSGQRAVAAAVHPGRRRLGVLVDVRGAPRCEELAALLLDLLDVGYPTD